MNKTEMITEIYGASYRNNFEFDTALPQTSLDIIASDVSKYLNKDRDEIYRTVLYGCVYAYSKHDRTNGFLPLTSKALELITIFGELKKANFIFTPTLHEVTG
jgi:hypothetical protein